MQVAGTGGPWSRDLHFAHPADAVVFYGFDIQGVYDDFPYLRALVALVDPAADATLWSGVATCVAGTYTSSSDWDQDVWGQSMYAGTGTYSEEAYTACLAGLDEIDRWVAEHRAGLDAAIPDGAVLAAVAARSARAMQTELKLLLTDSLGAYDVRDAGMADNFNDFYGDRFGSVPTIVVAHDAHLDLDTSTYREAAGPIGWRNMGRYLAADHGDAYAPIGVFGRDVTYDWCAGPVRAVAPAITFEHRFGEEGVQYALLDTVAATEAGYVQLDLGGLTTFGHPSPSTGVFAEHFRVAIYLDVSPTFEPWFPCP